MIRKMKWYNYIIEFPGFMYYALIKAPILNYYIDHFKKPSEPLPSDLEAKLLGFTDRLVGEEILPSSAYMEEAEVDHRLSRLNLSPVPVKK